MISKTILAIDSSTGSCSVALWKNKAVVAYMEELDGTKQAKHLIPMIEKTLAEAAVLYSDLSEIACTIGPGGFTGIRIGLATARAIGFATKIPVMGFSGLEVIAFGARKNLVNAIINAGKGEVVYQHFNEKIEPLCEPTLAKLEIAKESLNNGVVVGYGSQHLITSPLAYLRADLLAEYAFLYPKKAVAPAPFYIRPPDAKLPIR